MVCFILNNRLSLYHLINTTNTTTTNNINNNNNKKKKKNKKTYNNMTIIFETSTSMHSLHMFIIMTV